jgi:hypothetical protein
VKNFKHKPVYSEHASVQRHDKEVKGFRQSKTKIKEYKEKEIKK